MKHCLTILLLLLTVTAIAQDKTPKLVLETSEHNFGRVKEATKVSYTFQLRNEGTADLLIEDIAPGCGCTTSDFDKVIPPGQVGKITLTILPSGTGVQTKYTTVYSNDPKLGEFRLTIKFEPFLPKGYRVGSYLFDPTNEIEATIAPGKSYEGKVGIYFSSDRVVAINKTVVDNPAFTAHLETVTPGREFKLLVKSSDKLPAGTNKLLVKLLTDDPNQEMLEVMFSVKIGSAAEAGAAVKPASATKGADLKPSQKIKPKTVK